MNIRVVDAGAHKDLFEHATEGKNIKNWINQEIQRVALSRIMIFENVESLLKKKGLENLPFKIPVRPGMPALLLSAVLQYVNKVTIKET